MRQLHYRTDADKAPEDKRIEIIALLLDISIGKSGVSYIFHCYQNEAGVRRHFHT